LCHLNQDKRAMSKMTILEMTMSKTTISKLILMFTRKFACKFTCKFIWMFACLVCLLHPNTASAWGYQGHEVVGAIADRLLSTNAKAQVRLILNGPDASPEPVSLVRRKELKLQQAGPWADCVKSVVLFATDGKFHYYVDPSHLDYEVPCVSFNSAEERARMEDYVRRNFDTCSYAPPPDGLQRGCHNTFHFEDVAIQRNMFDRNERGTNDHDLVAAIGATIAVLTDKPVPPPFPFSIRDKKEALLLLAHLIGDLHQPLHVGAVYLDAEGRLVDPDTAQWTDPTMDTVGGNAIQDQNLSLHHEWDDIPTDIGESWTKELLAAAQATPASQGPIDGWPKAWATDTLHAAQDAFKPLKFAPVNPPSSFYKWTVSFDDHMAYLRLMDGIKRSQLAKGGARLAEVLNTIWP
jgi:S1/P1 Nuclease